MKTLTEFLKEQYEIEFNNENLLKEAFTHSSYVNEHRLTVAKDNERLEFLGDAVLELTVSDFLYDYFPDYPEGILTRIRSSVVRETSLYHFSIENNFDRYVQLGKGEEAMQGRKRASLLADLFEAFLGALYLDQGIEVVNGFLEKTVFRKIKMGAFSHGMDFKTELQEYLQRTGEVTIIYELVDESGPAHLKEFTVEVSVEGHVLGRGTGSSKKMAEQQAADNALQQLKDQN